MNVLTTGATRNVGLTVIEEIKGFWSSINVIAGVRNLQIKGARFALNPWISEPLGRTVSFDRGGFSLIFAEADY